MTTEQVSTSQDMPAVQESIARVTSRVQLESVRLRYISGILGAASVDDLPSEWTDRARFEQHAQLILDEEVNREAALDADQQRFSVSATFRAEYWSAEPAHEDFEAEELVPDLGVFAVFELTYSLGTTEELTYQDLEWFARFNSLFNAWPYWRELAHSTTQRMGVPNPLIVRVLTVNALLAQE